MKNVRREDLYPSDAEMQGLHPSISQIKRDLAKEIFERIEGAYHKDKKITIIYDRAWEKLKSEFLKELKK